MGPQYLLQTVQKDSHAAFLPDCPIAEPRCVEHCPDINFVSGMGRNLVVFVQRVENPGLCLCLPCCMLNEVIAIGYVWGGIQLAVVIILGTMEGVLQSPNNITMHVQVPKSKIILSQSFGDIVIRSLVQESINDKITIHSRYKCLVAIKCHPNPNFILCVNKRFQKEKLLREFCLPIRCLPLTNNQIHNIIKKNSLSLSLSLSLTHTHTHSHIPPLT